MRLCVAAIVPRAWKKVKLSKVFLFDPPKVQSLFFGTPNTFPTDEVFIQTIIYVSFFRLSKKLKVIMGWNYYNLFQDTNIIILKEFTRLFEKRSVYDDSKSENVCSANRQIRMDRSFSRLTASIRQTICWTFRETDYYGDANRWNSRLWVPLWIHAHVKPSRWNKLGEQVLKIERK